MKVRLQWVPPFVVGAAAATVASIAVALLLYGGEGMLRSLTLIVATELAAFGIGLAAPPTVEWPGVVDSLRRRWVLMLVAFVAATVFTLGWTLWDAFDARPSSQAVGLALLAGLPLYASGYLLVAIAAAPVGEARQRIGAFAAFGAAAGVLMTGLSGLARVGAPSLLLFLLVVLSGAALVQGSVLEAPEESTLPPDVEPDPADSEHSGATRT